jgi:hypothetical protein
LVACADQLSIFEVGNDEGKDPLELLEGALTPSFEDAKRDHTVGHFGQLAGRDPNGPAQLFSIVDAAVEQHDKAIGNVERLSLEVVFGRQVVEAGYEGSVSS